MRRLLIANRGEIAVRIVRAAREQGITSIVVVSEADQDSLAARLADESVVIGPPQVARSYLDHDAVLGAAASSGADALHPGYGFLSENADFAERVIAEGLTWVGPDPESIRLMGDKAKARQAAVDAGVPTVVGSDGALPPIEELDAEALDALLERVGLPLLIKASAGGGGRGIRKVSDASEFAQAVGIAQAEAQAAFGSGEVYVERFIEQARHVEVQLLGDGETVVHLGDRDCSLQRRQQKMVEEAPAPGIPDHVRDEMRASSVRLAESSGYRGAGTIEFLYDPVRQEVAFIEMNTRLQVEHPVTEAIVGIDLVAEQLRIADGEKLGYGQGDIEFAGHSIEMRVNAENPAMNFFPSPGTITTLDFPGGPGIRIDSGFVAGSVVSPYYDSLVAKIIAHAPDRETAIARALRALDELRIEGVVSNASTLSDMLDSPEFALAQHHTGFVESVLETKGA